MAEEAKCRICGRGLTVPESVKREIGPVCWGRLQRGEITEEVMSLGLGMGLSTIPKKEAEG